MASSYTKDPDATLDWAFDWTSWLVDAETIVSHTILTDGTVTEDSSSDDGGVVTVWLSGGEVRDNAEVTCRIVTDQGRTDDRTITVRVRER